MEALVEFQLYLWLLSLWLSLCFPFRIAVRFLDGFGDFVKLYLVRCGDVEPHPGPDIFNKTDWLREIYRFCVGLSQDGKKRACYKNSSFPDLNKMKIKRPQLEQKLKELIPIVWNQVPLMYEDEVMAAWNMVHGRNLDGKELRSLGSRRKSCVQLQEACSALRISSADTITKVAACLGPDGVGALEDLVKRLRESQVQSVSGNTTAGCPQVDVCDPTSSADLRSLPYADTNDPTYPSSVEASGDSSSIPHFELPDSHQQPESAVFHGQNNIYDAVNAYFPPDNTKGDHSAIEPERDAIEADPQSPSHDDPQLGASTFPVPTSPLNFDLDWDDLSYLESLLEISVPLIGDSDPLLPQVPDNSDNFVSSWHHPALTSADDRSVEGPPLKRARLDPPLSSASSDDSCTLQDISDLMLFHAL